MINKDNLIKIEKNALIIRKYNLGDEQFFYKNLHTVNKTGLKIIWEKENKKVQNKEIIKNSNDINQTELNIINKNVSEFENNIQNIYDYLISKFNFKKLKLNEENIERRFRHLLAEKFIELNSKEILKEIKKDEEERKYKKEKKQVKTLKFVFFFGIICLFFGARIYDGFTPVKELTIRIHERSKYEFSGSMCNDGTTSNSQGRGSCSWHKGVNYEFYEGDYSKSIDKCRKEAIEKSWIE